MVCELAKRVKERSAGGRGGGQVRGAAHAACSVPPPDGASTLLSTAFARAAPAEYKSPPALSPNPQVDFHPAFVWLLRDFQLQLASSGGGRVSPGERAPRRPRAPPAQALCCASPGMRRVPQAHNTPPSCCGRCPSASDMPAGAYLEEVLGDVRGGGSSGGADEDNRNQVSHTAHVHTPFGG